MRTKFLLTVLLLAAGFGSCKKSIFTPETPDGGDGGVNIPWPQLQLPHGEPIGEGVTAEIGSAGGTINSADGIISVTVPAGAVNQNTVFSIQKVENVLDTLTPAFRLSPEGIGFQKPLTLSYHFGKADMQGNNPANFRLIYQDAEGKLFRPKGWKYDATGKTMSIETTHFSDWFFSSQFEIVVGTSTQHDANNIPHISGGQTVKLLANESFGNSNDTSELLIPALVVSETAKNAQWAIVSGGGSLAKTGPDNSQMLYTAPQDLTSPRDVLVSCTVRGDFGKDPYGNPVKEIIMLQTLKVDVEYFTYTLDGGTPHICKTFGTTSTGNGEGIVGTDGPYGTLDIYVYAGAPGMFDFNLPNTPGAAYIQFEDVIGGYFTYKPKDCSGEVPGLDFSKGSVTIKTMAHASGEYTTGTVEGATVYSNEYCDKSNTVKKIALSAKFSIKMP